MSQPTLFARGFSDDVADARTTFAASSPTNRGAVNTKPEVVDFILRLSGFSTRRPLSRVLEPSFGAGDFLLPVVDRLLHRTAKLSEAERVSALLTKLVAVELNRDTFDAVRTSVEERLAEFKPRNRQKLLDSWLVCDDFLLTDLAGTFDFVVGNPPYVRQESVPDVLLREYKRRYTTIYDRADLYVPFIERGLRQLSDDGSLAFICADRWVKNKYGGPLRQLVSSGYHLSHYVDMYETDSFSHDVVAYPAITVIQRSSGTETRIAKQPEISAVALTALAKSMTNGSTDVRTATEVVYGDAPWLVDCPDQLKLVRHLEHSFPTLEQAGCRIGIGVATGADKAYIGQFDNLPVEASRKLPLVMTSDIETGSLDWRGKGVINPFTDDGDLVDLAKFPRLQAYLEKHRKVIAGRHCAKKNPTRWYRTIDRITPSLQRETKLLIPDIKGQSNIVYDDGQFYPHHNLYFITSSSWNLLALRAVMLAGVAQLFVSTYSTRMRGGFFRFQAQYLRRICVPEWSTIPSSTRKKLITAGTSGTVKQCHALTSEIYGFDKAEQQILEANNGS